MSFLAPINDWLVGVLGPSAPSWRWACWGS
jgi:hypothetical protein